MRTDIFSYHIFIILLYLNYGIFEELLKEELLHVSIIFRHGERAPDITFPSYKYVSSHWKSGPGNLTERGRNQVKRLGEGMSKRYLTAIPASEDQPLKWACGGSFKSKSGINTLAYASKSFRSRESAHIFLKAFAGLPEAPPVALIKFPDPAKPDLLLSGAIRCKALVTYVIKEEFVKNPLLLNYTLANKDFFTYLGEKTGYGRAAVIYILPVADTLSCDKVAGYPLPDWADEATYSRIQDLAHFIFSHLGRSNDIIIKGSVGLLTKKILDQMDAVSQASKNPTFCDDGSKDFERPSISLYSAHDHTIVPMLSMLNIPFTNRPGYGAAVTLELWSQLITGSTVPKFVVKLSYKNYEGAVFRYEPIVWDLSKLRESVGQKLPASQEELESYCEKGEDDSLPFKTDVFHK